MRAWEIGEAFGLDHLRLVERPDPTPGPGRIVVRIRCASLNYRDLLMVRGTYNPRLRLPLIPLSDGVGDVIAVGEGVTRVAVGQRVLGLFAQGWLDGDPGRDTLKTTLGGPLDGMLAEQVELDADGVVPAPAYLDDAEAATLPCAALTAWSALVGYGRVQPGDVVLVQGTGGVSLFALQIATMAGARVIATSSSDDKLGRVEAMGATEVINYRADPQWGRTARTLTDGRGVDHVIEVGGAGTMEQSLMAVRPGGNVHLIGILSGASGAINLNRVLMHGVRVQGVFVGHRAGMEAMLRAVEQHRPRPVVDRIFPFEEAPAAFAHLASGAHFGKVCIRVNDESTQARPVS